MELMQNSNLVIWGFVIWLLMAPKQSSSRYGELFLAYMTTLLFSLVGSTEIMMIKPVAFFFTIGGVLAFFLVIGKHITFAIVSKGN